MEFENFLISSLYKQIVESPYCERIDVCKLNNLWKSLPKGDLVENTKKFVKSWALMDVDVLELFVNCDYNYNNLCQMIYKRNCLINNQKLNLISSPERLVKVLD